MDELIMTIMIFAFLLFACIGISSATDSIHCSAVGKTLNYKTEWHYGTGCVVEKPDGSRVLLKQMRDTEK